MNQFCHCPRVISRQNAIEVSQTEIVTEQPTQALLQNGMKGLKTLFENISLRGKECDSISLLLKVRVDPSGLCRYWGRASSQLALHYSIAAAVVVVVSRSISVSFSPFSFIKLNLFPCLFVKFQFSGLFTDILLVH